MYEEEDDITFEQIKKLQEDRKKGLINKNNNKDERYDTSIEISTKKKDKKRKSIDDEEKVDNRHHDKFRKELDSYHAPKNILDTIPLDPNDDNPLKSYRPQTVAERETEYQSRWRKRSFSPPRDYDPFTGKGDVKGRTYKDIMIENALAREEKEIMLKIANKQKEEDDIKRKEKRDNVNNKNDAKKQRISNNNSSSSSSSNSGSSNSTSSKSITSNSGEKYWFIKVYKNGVIQGESLSIQKDKSVTFGRDPKNIVVLEHPSCSSQHASISIFKEGKRPILLDLRSTNQTFLNNKPIEPHKPEELYHGDVIKFGASTREYVINHN